MTTKKHLGNQGKEIIAKVYHRLKYEAVNGVEKLTDARWRTAQAVGVSESTITRILRAERKASTSKESSDISYKLPTKKIRQSKSKTTASNQQTDLDIAILRRNLLSFHKLHLELKEKPTLKKLVEVLNERIAFNGSIESLRNLLIESGGYEWSKPNENYSKTISEKHSVQMLRFEYLKNLEKYRNEGRYIVFCGECYIDTSHIPVRNKCLKEVKETALVNKQLSKGTPVIVVHAGGFEGFVSNAFFMYKANSTNPDDQDSLKNNNYRNWLQSQLLPNIPENSVIVMNNATYDNILSLKIPDSRSDKSTMETWLVEKNIPYKGTMNKIELYDLILKNKDDYIPLLIHQMIRSKGFEILLLPPYHPELNPIEKIWSTLKTNISKKKVGQSIASLIVDINEHIKMIDQTEWDNTWRIVEETEQQYWQYFNMGYEITIHDNSTDSDDSSDSDSVTKQNN